MVFYPLVASTGRAYIYAMEDSRETEPVVLDHISKRYVAALLAVSFTMAIAVDAADGTMDYEHNGTAKILEAVGSSLATGPGQGFTYVENTVVGGEHQVIPPENSHTGQRYFIYKST